MDTNVLFNSLKTDTVTLKNRIVMGPMTRNRANNKAEAPTEIHAEYYAQRASAGLIITEGAPVSKRARGYLYTPGIYSQAQIDGWKNVTDAVHEKGGKIFIQLWHCGRVSHNWFHNGAPPLAPSALKADSKVFTPNGFEDVSMPRELTKAEIAGIVQEFRVAARNAIDAGFDGVQVHGANGYLIEQFLHDSSNHRTDEYGGSIENKSRFLFEILDAVKAEIGSEQTSLRLSPSNLSNTDNDSQSAELYEYVISNLNSRNLCFLELMEPLMPLDNHPHLVKNVGGHFRSIYEGVMAVNGNLTRESGAQLIENGIADLVTYARLFIANPDLPERFRLDVPLNNANTETFYGGGVEGYTDYPALDKKSACNS